MIILVLYNTLLNLNNKLSYCTQTPLSLPYLTVFPTSSSILHSLSLFPLSQRLSTHFLFSSHPIPSHPIRLCFSTPLPRYLVLLHPHSYVYVYVYVFCLLLNPCVLVSIC